MKYISSLLKRVPSLFLLSVILTSTLIGTVGTQIAYAYTSSNVNPVPVRDKKPADWFSSVKVKFVNRGTVKLTFDAGSNIAYDKGGGRFITFNELFEGTYRDDDFSGGDGVEYKYKTHANDNSRIYHFSGNLNDIIDPGSSGFEDYDKKISLSDIQSSINSADLQISVEKTRFPGIDCDEGNINVAKSDGGWECRNEGEGTISISLDGHFEDLNNFNISYAYSPDPDTPDSGTVKSLVAGESKDFKWCESRGGGAGGLFVQGDCSAEDFLVLGDNSRAAKPSDMEALGSGSQTFKVTHANRSETYDTVIAGSDSDAANVPNAPGTGDTASDGAETPCVEKLSEEGGLGWIICPVLEMIDNVSNKLINEVDSLLAINKQDFNDDNGDLRKAWSYFRNIASFALIIIGLIMVIGQATTKE